MHRAVYAYWQLYLGFGFVLGRVWGGVLRVWKVTVTDHSIPRSDNRGMGMRQNEEVPRKSSLEWMREDVRLAHLGENSRGRGDGGG